MADRPMKLRDLRRTVAHYDVWEDASRGKGSHTMFFRKVGGDTRSYPVPTGQDPVAKVYVRSLRSRLALSAADGVPDDEFYSR